MVVIARYYVVLAQASAQLEDGGGFVKAGKSLGADERRSLLYSGVLALALRESSGLAEYR